MAPSRRADLVRHLTSVLGPTLVSTLAGSKDTRAAVAWSSEEGPHPDADAIDRLECAEAVWQKVSDAEGPDVARLWFIGANPWLGNSTAVTAIRDGRFDEVAGAAQALVDGSFSG